MPIHYIPKPIHATINNVTGARAFGVLYTNTLPRPIQLIIACTHQVTVAASFCLANLFVNGAGMGWGGWFNTPGVGVILYSTIIGMVPANGTYQLTQNAAGGINTILSWREVEL